MVDKLLFIDTETGGIDPINSSLLSIGLVVWSNKIILDTKELLINDGKLKATKEALSINNIDLKIHKKISLPPKVVIHEFLSFLKSNFSQDQRITLAGHNVNFDINFLKFFLEKYKYKFGDFFSHRIIDTSSILYYLYLSGKLKYRVFSSTDAFNYFGIHVENRHSALGDAIATAELFTKLIYLTNKKLKSNLDDLDSQASLFEKLSTSRSHK